ncbi:hypothetical protein FAZ95_17915 [Trinickia violacea]|uniref:Uncharacterized protein n=1 Tax=Trinickia violacea TaxID=2571746 RepID=A0A4P8IU34_9BURK|nr:hypothetical protein [Trinickia violacea]QCP50863.1 hypothetical protein FAZ95_17915 [Trinickia violacea]
MRQTERQATRDETDCVNAPPKLTIAPAIFVTQSAPRRQITLPDAGTTPVGNSGGTSGAWETSVANDDQRIIAPAAHSHENIFMPLSCMGNRF